MRRVTKAQLTEQVRQWKVNTYVMVAISLICGATTGYYGYEYSQLETATAHLVHLIQTEPEAFCPSSGGPVIVPTPAPPPQVPDLPMEGQPQRF